MSYYVNIVKRDKNKCDNLTKKGEVYDENKLHDDGRGSRRRIGYFQRSCVQNCSNLESGITGQRIYCCSWKSTESVLGNKVLQLCDKSELSIGRK